MASLLLNICALSFCIASIGARTQFDLPIARIYSVEDNNRLRPWKKIDSNFETTIENIEHLRLDCLANYPVQWIYTGNGIPEYTTSNKYSRKNSHGETSSEFIATLLINPLKEHHTGRYACSPGEYIDGKTFFHIFVPGQNLFTSITGHNIILPKNDTTIIIPCTVSNPNAAVNLEKSDGERGGLRKIRVRTSDAVVYDPKIGFTVKLNKIESPEGTYVCTARHGSFVRSVEYRVSSSYANYQADSPSNLQNKCQKKCGENAFCDIIDGRESCTCLPEFNGDPDLKCVIKCNAHTDCPSTMSCFVDRQCRSPCIHSAHGCGINARCKVENHRPVCYCPKDWLGDETVQCFNSLQGSEPSRPDSSSTSDRNPSYPRSGVKCGSNTDCPANMTCIRLSSGASKEKECVNPCSTRRCGRNAVCVVEERRSSCECLPGFGGDARIECEPLKKDRNPFSEPLIQGDSGDYYEQETIRDRAKVKEVYLRRRCMNPEQCGSNAECRLDKSGNQQCFCREGFMGQPPKCRAECSENKDCPENHACVTDKRVGYPSCTKTCGSRICGAHADCAKFDDGNHECYCPDGLYGDPLVKCETKEMRLGKDCATDYDCGIQLRCEIGADDRKCVDPCSNKRCPSEFVCRGDNHAAKCVCPPGSTGNEYVGCNRDALEGAPCANISCGANSECRVVSGKPTCYCQSGYLGKPPICIAECLSNSDCPSDLSCISRRCRHRCSGCGKNTRCRVAPNLERNSVCSCLDGFEGNPYVECRPYV